MFRIGHLGDSNDLTLLGALAGCEMGLKLAGVRLAGSGVQAAMEHFAEPRLALGRLPERRTSQQEITRCNDALFSRPTGAAVATLAAPRLMAQEWPNAPVRIVVGFPPGGGTDALARVVAAKLTQMWNQQVIVETKGRRRRRARRRIRGAAAERRQRRC